jgi:hypothetical protein
VGKSNNLLECYKLNGKLTYMKITKGNNMTITIVDPLKIADTILDSGYTFQQELLFQALKREVTTGMLMTNPRVTGFPSFAKAVLHFLQDKKAPKTKKNLYHYLVKQGVYDKVSWGKK